MKLTGTMCSLPVRRVFKLGMETVSNKINLSIGFDSAYLIEYFIGYMLPRRTLHNDWQLQLRHRNSADDSHRSVCKQ